MDRNKNQENEKNEYSNKMRIKLCKVYNWKRY